MNIETKLLLNNLQKNMKRTIFTIISITLCTVLIFTSMLLISSIKNGISKNIETEYNDYHFILRGLDVENFNRIKGKEYIEKIYIQEKDSGYLKRIEDTSEIEDVSNIYIRYNNVKDTCKNSTDILNTLDLSSKTEAEKREFIENCGFNKKLLTIYGLIDLEITQENYKNVCRARVNYSYVLDIMIVFILLANSILFIIILYNAFLITINERKKEYAILNSIGATETQILKMIFLEATIIGIIGIIIGWIVSSLVSIGILEILNSILVDTSYNFNLIFDVRYVIISMIIIIINIFISAIIPSIKASTTSVIQEIRNNKQIKYKKSNSLLDKILPIEGKLALRNIKRNKSKYRIITILLVICMTSYIAISTYINYEKQLAELVNEFDVDAELRVDTDLEIDYKNILNEYKTKTGDKLDCLEYKMIGAYVLVEPSDALLTDSLVTVHDNNKKSIQIVIIGLDDNTYNDYIDKLEANYGDFIIYNNITLRDMNEDKITYSYSNAFKTSCDFNLSVIAKNYDIENGTTKFKIIDDKNLNGNYVLTDEIIEGFKEMKTKYIAPSIFVNMDTFNKLENEFNNFTPKNSVKKWIWNDNEMIYVKIKCKNIIGFSNYIDEIREKQNLEVDAEYYSLDNKEKLIYIDIIQLILAIIMLAIVVIGSISTINIINASLCERKQEFKILHSLGATKNNIRKILIYECIYMFVKSTIIAIILAIPILYGIIRYMENVIMLDKLLIPFGNISVFFLILFVASLGIMVYSTKFIQEDISEGENL